MRKYTVCYLLLFFSISAYGQQVINQRVDSLKAILAKLPPERTSFSNDTLRVKVLCALAFRMAFSKPDSSVFYSEQALKIGERLNHILSIARANHQLGYSYLMLGKDFESSEYFFKSLKLSEQIKSDTLIASNNRQIAHAYFELKKYDLAEKHYNKAMPYFLKINYKKGYANCLNDIGRSYYMRKDYEKALAYFQQCLVYARKNGIQIMENYCTWSIANTYIEKKEYDKALAYATIGMKLNETIEGMVEYDWVMGYEALARIYSGKGDFKQALYYAEKPFKQFSDIREYNKLPLYERLYVIHKELGNYQKALYYHEEYIRLAEDSKKQEYEKQLESMRFEYDNMQLKENNALLNQDLIRETLIKKGLIIGVIGVLIFVVFFWWNNRLLKDKNQLIENQKEEILLVKTEVEELNKTLERKVEERTSELIQANNELTQKNQEISAALVKGQTLERKRVASELHDNLGSTLSGIRWMLQAIDRENLTSEEKKVYTNILNMMNNAYEEVRLISHNLLPDDFEQKGLFGALHKLTSDINQSGKLKIALVIEKDVIINDQKTALELYSICMELINNILKHAQATQAEIRFEQSSENWYVTVKDNGRGADINSANNGKGIKNIKNRVEALAASISFNSIANKSTIIKVTVPFIA
ncbi:tetratricopeptide repeat-containing sensor histidine kinase [Emticicia agri]|uniref:histidine kinase n=1 Tax=Emticicia agri TaxID=2492393 RepID=A0A4Q5M098_9BACT|nr:tetratricopeptide repeat protein [Emticicia agri]RYU95552.1 tetratricopeptide repeat protein [Emticicia agri]